MSPSRIASTMAEIIVLTVEKIKLIGQLINVGRGPQPNPVNKCQVCTGLRDKIKMY